MYPLCIIPVMNVIKAAAKLAIKAATIPKVRVVLSTLSHNKSSVGITSANAIHGLKNSCAENAGRLLLV